MPHPVHLSATSPTKPKPDDRADSLTPTPWRNLYESATLSSPPRLESPPIAPSCSGDSTAPDSQTVAQMSDHPFPHSHRRSPRSASQIPHSGDAGRPNATSPDLHSYSPYTTYYPLYPPPTNIDPSLATSPPNYGYPQFYHQGSHSPDPGLVSTVPGHSGYHQSMVHSQPHYSQPTYSTDGSSSYSSAPARPASHPFSPPPPSTSTLGSGSQTQSSPAIFSGTAQFSTVQHFPPHAIQGTQYPYPQPSYPASSRHQVFSPPPPAQYHPTPAENDRGQHVGWWYAVPAGISMAQQFETSSRMPYQTHPQYPAPFNPHDQRYSPAGPLPVASGGRSSQGTPRRGTINVTNPSSASTLTGTPPVLQRSDSAPTSPTQHSPASGNNSTPRRGSQQSTSAPKAPGAPGPPRSVASATEKGSTRRSYHPNPPASRSEWVMWVGNVPPDATEDELWQFFCSPTPPEKEHLSRAQQLTPPGASSLAPPPSNSSPSRSSPSSGSRPSTATPSASSTPQSITTAGIISIFLISRSCCAFVNYENEARLRNAIARFNGKILRPSDPKCPKLVCRERKKEDDLKAGVGGQRGTGMHSKWIKEQKVKVASPAPMLPSEDTKRPEPKPLHEHSGAESTTEDEGTSKSHRTKNRRTSMSSSSGSYSSTTSSLLTRFFPKRYFILKSLTQFDVDLSVKEGLWATQKHNEGILDQAYRTSQDVYLIFSVNKSGEFYGYARMAGPVRGGEHSVSWASRTPSSSRSSLIPGSTLAIDGQQEGGGASVPQSAPVPSSDHSEPKHAAHSMPELGAGSAATPGSKRSFLSPRDNKGIAESPLSLDEGEEGEDGSQLPTIKEESPGSTPPSDDGQRHTYPPNLIPRPREDGWHPARQSFSAPPEFAATRRALGDHTITGPRSEERLNTTEFTVPPLIELNPNAPIQARRSPPESPDKDKDEGGSEVGDRQEEEDDGHDKLGKLPVEGEDQAAEGVGKKTEGTKREESWGEPFKIEWLCLQKLSFQRTRQIRNPWNHDREVKVSRDGTELEPVVGQTLLDEFAKLVEELKQGQSAEGKTTINPSGGNEDAVGGNEA